MTPTVICAAMKRCLAYGALFGAAATAVLWLLAEPIGFLWIGDARTVMSLRLAAFSMPCVSLCSSLSGYFTACGRVWKPTLVHIFEQLLGIALVVSRGWASQLLHGVLGFLRAIPVLMLIFWIYFLLPMLLGMDVPGTVSVVCALSLIGGADVAAELEAKRAIDQGSRLAAQL